LPLCHNVIRGLLKRGSQPQHVVRAFAAPPYGSGLGDAFVRHALDLTSRADCTVAMLLNPGETTPVKLILTSRIAVPCRMTDNRTSAGRLQPSLMDMSS
jgi:hypothetical protein